MLPARYTNKVHLGGLTKGKGLKPMKMVFVCLAAISSRQGKLFYSILKILSTYLIVIFPSANSTKAVSSSADPTTNKRSPKSNVV